MSGGCRRICRRRRSRCRGLRKGGGYTGWEEVSSLDMLLGEGVGMEIVNSGR